MIKDVWPIIRNCLGYADQRLVDYASLCVIRVIESYHRSHSDKLEVLVDADLIRAINMLLLPSGGSSLVPPGTFTLLIRSLATAARASPNIAIALLQADIVTTLHQILTGVLPSNYDDSEEQGDSATGQGLGGGLADMTVMQNLAHRPKDQVEEALTLISELLPPLPKGKLILFYLLSGSRFLRWRLRSQGLFGKGATQDGESESEGRESSAFGSDYLSGKFGWRRLTWFIKST